jgi:hypothetical protein
MVGHEHEFMEEEFPGPAVFVDGPDEKLGKRVGAENLAPAPCGCGDEKGTDLLWGFVLSSAKALHGLSLDSPG